MGKGLDRGAGVTDRLSAKDKRRRNELFLVEVYATARAVANDAEASIKDATSRRPCANAAEATDLLPELVSAIFIPGDETAFFIVRARDEVEVRGLLARARVRFDRIVPADAESFVGASFEPASTATNEPAG
jgi:hypothetical protein